MEDKYIEEMAKKALTKPDDFGYWGSDEMFNTWGFSGFYKSRDSNNLDLSNFDYISDDLMSKYPNDFRIESYSHWAVGSVDQLCVRILKAPGFPNVENVTQQFIECLKWHDDMQDYPVANEEHYYEICHKDLVDTITNYFPSHEAIDTSGDDWAEKIANELESAEGTVDMSDTYCYLRDDHFYQAVYDAGLYSKDREHYEFWKEFCEKNKLEPLKYDFIKSESDQTLFNDL